MSGTNLRFVLVPGKVKEKIIRRALGLIRNGLCKIGGGENEAGGNGMRWGWDRVCSGGRQGAVAAI